MAYKYDRVSEDNFLEEDDETLHRRPRRPRSGASAVLRLNFVWAYTFQTIFFLVSCGLFISGLSNRKFKGAGCHDEDFLPMWSPVLEAVRNTGHFHRFDGSFATPNAYKGSPSLQIDKAWDRVLMAEGGVIGIDEETLQKINGSRQYSVKLGPEVGGGYMASVEVLHQLHCLNMLRQATYEDYYKDKAEPWEDSPQTLRYHLDHCIDNIRQKLMCEADTGILTYVWVKGHPAPFPDFNVQHKCRDIDNILDWVSEHQLHMTKGSRIERQPNAQELESPP